MQTLKVLKPRPEGKRSAVETAPGIFASRDKGIVTQIIEPQRMVMLREPAVSSPSDVELPDSFRTGPVFVMQVRDGYFEADSGFAFDSRRRLIMESVMKRTLLTELEKRFDQMDFDGAEPIESAREVFLVSNQRRGNYCRWWLDLLSKYYLFERAGPLHRTDPLHMTFVGPHFDKAYQLSSLQSLGLLHNTITPRRPILRGTFYMTSGLTFKGGQNISAEIAGFRTFVSDRLSKRKRYEATRARLPRIYISRDKTTMRRVRNEPELVTFLERHGFAKVHLEDLDVLEQILLFEQAEFIVSPHGAGLTNILFCRPGTKLLEIFPDRGLHSSAFMRMATLLDISYGYHCAGSLANDVSDKNPANLDIVCDIPSFASAFEQFSGSGAPAAAPRASIAAS